VHNFWGGRAENPYPWNVSTTVLTHILRTGERPFAPARKQMYLVQLMPRKFVEAKHFWC
jgi:hypothetical protein